jgi:hypothetical protein
MGNQSKCEIHLRFTYSLWIYKCYLWYKNKLSAECNYNFHAWEPQSRLEFYMCGVMSARKEFPILEVFRFWNFG